MPGYTHISIPDGPDMCEDVFTKVWLEKLRSCSGVCCLGSLDEMRHMLPHPDAETAAAVVQVEHRTSSFVVFGYSCTLMDEMMREQESASGNRHPQRSQKRTSDFCFDAGVVSG